MAHGTINSIDTSAAEAMEGVLKVFTSADFESAGGMPCGWQVTDKSRHGEPMQEPKHPILAEGKVRHVGDPIACVVAETLEQARDAAEAVEIDIDELEPVLDMKAALEDGAPKVHDELTSNLCYDWGSWKKTRRPWTRRSNAAHVVTLELTNNRLVANPMEPRVAVADYNRARR